MSAVKSKKRVLLIKLFLKNLMYKALTLILFLSSNAQGDDNSVTPLAFGKSLFDCAVPFVDGPEAQVRLSISEEDRIDFVTIEILNTSKDMTLFIQKSKGALIQDVKSGSIMWMLMTDRTGNENGVLLNTGFLLLQKGNIDSFSGLMSAQGNIYPLQCTLKYK